MDNFELTKARNTRTKISYKKYHKAGHRGLVTSAVMVGDHNVSSAVRADNAFRFVGFKCLAKKLISIRQGMKHKILQMLASVYRTTSHSDA